MQFGGVWAYAGLAPNVNEIVVTDMIPRRKIEKIDFANLSVKIFFPMDLTPFLKSKFVKIYLRGTEQMGVTLINPGKKRRHKLCHLPNSSIS